jgi:hypothetical protein
MQNRHSVYLTKISTMQIITVELINDNALTLLQQLEQLNILRLVAIKKQSTEQPKRKWAGSISKETATKMLQYVEQSRNEWERNI